jgi:O-antigen ligase
MHQSGTQKITTWAYNLGTASVCGMAVSMTVSRALFNLFALLMVVAWVASGRFRHLGSEAKQSPVVLLCLLLYGWITIAAAYSAASAALAWDQVATYSKLLLIPLMASFVHTPQRTKALWISLAGGLMLLQGSYLADMWIDIPGSLSAKTGAIGVFNNYIVEGLSLATWALTMTAASAMLLKQRSWAAVATLVLASVAVYCVLFVNPGRGAQLALISGMVVLVFLLMPKRIRWAGAAAAIVIIGAVALQSSVVTQRFDQALNEAKAADTAKQTSVGLRINAWRAGLSLWSESPLIGHGTGSFQHLMQTQKGEMVGGCEGNPVCLQPHSQYVLLLAEQGAVGLLLFLALLGAMVWPALKSEHVAAKLSAAFACAFAVHSAFDSGLRMGTQMFVFMVMAVALTAAVRLKWPENG